MKVKIMISQPMNGKTNEEIKKEREMIVKGIEASGAEYLDTVLDLSEEKTPLHYLSKSIEYLDKADVVYFMPGWENSRGCRIEFECAKEYGKYIKCITKEEYEKISNVSKDIKKIKIKLKSCFDESIDEKELEENIKKFKTDLEEMLNDLT